ncbi:E3 ubiquitin-protein ligase TTC3 isoform X2 [Astyanax mexicanus]|uniref:E3 ubiquitin-protein ligase TTC3 isoform X2 n=1 Tax=Astyanax mexicanus TaxID=7994 RepID=UPI0020CAD3EB|nr:E3 ubiquitin-protein ligase TTC3 isoform X2 [Astyanax mexicanus]
MDRHSHLDCCSCGLLPTMLESDDSDIEDGPDVVRHKTKIIYQNTFPYIHMEPPDVLYERWARIKLEVREAVGHMMHISVFWWHILFRQQDNHDTTAWAVDMGFLDSNVSNDLNLKRLHRIELLELILNTVERCLADTDPERKARELVLLSTSFKLQEECLVKAVSWLEEFGPTGLSRRLLDLGSKHIRYQILQFIFIEYARYIQVMSCSKKKMIRELSVDPDQWNLQKSEEMKNKGNEQFQKKKYDMAVKWYTKAIKYHTNNHLLYGNRALCFIRCEKYLKAMGDGKRAIILQKNWAKGHYRFCDALFFLGAKDKAVEANVLAQQLCGADPEGMRDLQQQYFRFLNEPYEEKDEVKPRKPESKKAPGKRFEAACGMEPSTEHLNSHREPELVSCTKENEKAEDRREEEDPPGKSRSGPHAEESSRASRDAKSEMPDRKTKKVPPGTPEKTTLRSKHSSAPEKPQPSNSGAGSKEQFCAAVQDAHTALTDQRCRNAEQAFSLALNILESSGIEALGITTLDRSLLIYGCATALVEIGQPEDLAKARRQFKELSSLEDRKFQSLVHYGNGNLYLKENRFSEALEEFCDALLMVQRKITPGKLTWPTTKVTIEETRPEYLEEQLQTSIELCKFPPKPDAMCRYDNCRSKKVYFTDPDFKGFIRITCCQSCNVEYHINCWKKLKSASFADKNDKDFLQDFCFTPDCTGRICHFVIFGSTGLIKCKFESSVPKSKAPGRLRVKQKCTSLKKLKSKEDRKLKRKQQRAAAAVANSEANILTREEGRDHQREEQTASTKEDYTKYGDRVLQQIYERREHFNDEIHNISTMLTCLRSWMELDEANGHVSMLKDCAEPHVLSDLVDLLLKRSNRVWARLFVHKLSGCSNLKPKLHDWALQLDRAGFVAAQNFIDRYGNRLEDLDLSPLLEFHPLKEVLIEKFGTMPDLFDISGVTVMDYLRQAPPQEMRLFIWALEEHRERYPTCCTILDEYFETDGICLVIRKTENDEHLSSGCKGKSKNRKKKQKEPKPVLVLSGMRSGALRDEDDEDIFSEEDSLFLLDATDPFSVPDRLRERVAEFEGHYTGRLNQNKRVLDNNPDPTKESLYDYFAQILEQYGPLEVSNPLLVGELENFPLEAQQKIEGAGGLEAFLLESLRFVMNENRIGLTRHAVTLQNSMADDASAFPDCVPHTFGTETLEFRGSYYLDPTAREFLPQYEHFSDRNASCDIPGILSDEDSSASGLCEPTLPDPYVLESQQARNGDCMFVPEDTSMFAAFSSGLTVPECSGYVHGSELNFYNSAYPPEMNSINACSEKGGGQPCSEIIRNEAKKSENKTISVQTFGYNKDTKDDVAVNTEPCALLERNKGDMILKEKNNIKLEKCIQNAKDTRSSRQITRKEELSVLEAQVKEAQQKIEITNKELSLFQQKLEEEIRKDQQEKKHNQETLKTLKGEIKELLDLQESYTKQIQDKNEEYQTALNQFCAISNQSAAEKMSLEEEIKRRRDVCAKASNRSVAAQLSVLQNKRENGLRKLKKCVGDGKAILQNMTELSSRYPSGSLFSTIEAWKSCVLEAEEKIRRTRAQYEEQIELLKKGTKLCSLPPVSVPNAPAPPPLPIRRGENGSIVVLPAPGVEVSLELQLPFLRPPPGFSPWFLPPLPIFRPALPYVAQGQSVAAQMQEGRVSQEQAFLNTPSNQQQVPQQFPVGHRQPHAPYSVNQHPVRPQMHSAVYVPLAPPAERIVRTQPAPSVPATRVEAPQKPAAPAPAPAQASAPAPVQQHLSVFEKIIDHLSLMFPHYSRAVLSKFIQEVRNASGSLNQLTYEEVINRVTQLILDHQDESREQISLVRRAGVRENVVPSPTPSGDSSRATPTPPPAHVWKSVSSHQRGTSKALNMEDPCIICHEDMATEDLCVLECRHSFHRECIKSWLREQSTCPTCREHALLPEDFPMLPGRHHRGHTSAASSS